MVLPYSLLLYPVDTIAMQVTYSPSSHSLHWDLEVLLIPEIRCPSAALGISCTHADYQCLHYTTLPPLSPLRLQTPAQNILIVWHKAYDMS